jgi:hypothetical protein
MKPKWGPAEKEYGLNAQNELCETDDPKVVKFLVPKGGYVDWDVAVKYGLPGTTSDGEPQADALVTAAGHRSSGGSKRGALDLRSQKKPSAKKK